MNNNEYLDLIKYPEEINYDNYEELIPKNQIRPRYYFNYWYKLDDRTGLLVMKRRRDSTITHVLFDLEDFSKISTRSWYPHREESKPASLIYVYSNEGYRLHRMIMDCPKDKCIDHINRLPLDNRKSNMRICTVEENNKNMSMNRRNTSGVRGVTQDKRRNGWVAQRYLNGIYYSKRFKTFEEACKYRKYLETLK